MTNYQKQILKDIQQGALLQCSEGINYKAWLKYQDGSIRNVRRDSACRVCDVYQDKLIFGNLEGIKWNTNYKEII